MNEHVMHLSNSLLFEIYVSVGQVVLLLEILQIDRYDENILQKFTLNMLQ